MGDYLPLVLFLLALVVLFCIGLRKSSAPEYPKYRAPLTDKPHSWTDGPFRLPDKWHLFTPAESTFLRVLDLAVGEQYRIFGKVRLEDIVPELRRRPDMRISWQSASLMHVDFVLCDKADLSVVACVELDDKSHSYEDAKRRDAEKDRVIKAAGIPMLRFTARASYRLDELRASLWDALPIDDKSPVNRR